MHLPLSGIDLTGGKLVASSQLFNEVVRETFLADKISSHRLEKVATFLPKKDLAAVKRRFALLQVQGFGRLSSLIIMHQFVYSTAPQS